MAWYEEAVFYHIYPLGLTGAPRQNSYGEPEHRLRTLIPWISHIREIGCNAIYIGPLFESVGHGYETTDYKKLDSRLGTNEDLTDFVAHCHRQGIHVILDGVFNHTGRDFFAFQDIKKNRENSAYRDWYCNVNFWGNNEYNDGFSYDNWGGYNLLAKLNQRNPAVRDYICDVIRFWVQEFDIDGIRLDAADVLDFEFMRALRQVANTVKPEFWLMGEVIHGDYTRWANADTLHSVTNYHLHKALYSGHNDHNYFEIAHTVRRLNDLGGPGKGLRLYNFTDNHDVERIYTKLNNKAHFVPVHVLLYTLPGIPSIYYGSEFGIEGKKERGSDDSLRPCLHLEDYADAMQKNSCTQVISRLGRAYQQLPALSFGNYTEHMLTTRQYAFSRNFDGQNVLVTVNNDDNSFCMQLPSCGVDAYVGVLTGRIVKAENGMVSIDLPGNSGEVWAPAGSISIEEEPGEEAVSSDREQEREEKAAGAFNEEDGNESAETLDERERSESSETFDEGETSELSETSDVEEKTEPLEDEAKETVEDAAEAESSPDKTAESEQRVDVTEEGATADETETAPEPVKSSEPFGEIEIPQGKSYEEMNVEELQKVVYEKMKKNGPVNERMLRDIQENVYHNSLVNWAKSFR